MMFSAGLERISSVIVTECICFICELVYYYNRATQSCISVGILICAHSS